MKYLIKQARIINEGTQKVQDLLIDNERIEKIADSITDPNAIEINAEGLWLLPGAIDDQVHFREPGLTHKGEIYTEAKAAVAGGITSYMEMPNTVPNVFTQELLEQKFARAADVCLANYSFFMGTSNDNYDEVMRFFSNGNELSNNSVSLAVLICKICKRVLCFLAKETAKEDDK